MHGLTLRFLNHCTGVKGRGAVKDSKTMAAAALVFALLVAAAAAPQLAAADPTYVGTGPCSKAVIDVPFTLPPEAKCKCNCDLTLHVSVPAGNVPRCTQSSFPTIIFYSGFLASNTAYQRYVDTLTSWGFAVVQYSFKVPFLASACSNDAAEAGYLPFILARLAAANTGQLNNKLDLTRTGATGHSRGGKLAALALAYGNVRAAYLIDPVDGFAFTAMLPGYPSAIAALKGKNLRYGITGASDPGPCNAPPLATGNYTGFFAEAAEGSTLEIVLNTGHTQFLELAALQGAAADKICCPKCSGLISEADAIALTTPLQIVFLSKELGLGGPIDFFGWIAEQVAAKRITFQVKGSVPVAAAGAKKEAGSATTAALKQAVSAAKAG